MLTEAGLAAMRSRPDLQLGEQLPALVRDTVSTPAVRLAVNSMVCPSWWCTVLQPALTEPNLRLLCHEGELTICW